MKKIIRKYKKIDCLVNASGVSNENSFIDNINSNLIDIYNVTKIVIEKMKKRWVSSKYNKFKFRTRFFKKSWLC